MESSRKSDAPTIADLGRPFTRDVLTLKLWKYGRWTLSAFDSCLCGPCCSRRFIDAIEAGLDRPGAPWRADVLP